MDQKIVNFVKKVVPHDIRIFFRKLNWKRHYILQNLFQAQKPKVYCPIAKREFKAFVRLQNELITPTNGARARQRLVWHFIENKLAILNRNAKLLHVAPEHAFYQVFKNQKNLTYVAGDKMVDGYSNQKGVQNIDLTKLSFPDNEFDFVLCNHVLEHIPDDGAAMSEIYRVLKSQGTAIITVPINESFEKTYENPSITSPKDRKEHFGQWDHVRWYAPDIKDRLEKHGFTVEMNRYGKEFSTEAFERFGFCNDIIVVAHKKP
ncbi:methyltransferase domain-containing protein [Cytophagaceae bacterium ABcell3]|nr:methyltransferase domain-containing protein [Cytophagaceae bacterium ABcell3]